MNIQEVKPYCGNYVVTTCHRCQARLDGRVENIYADLDGKAFVAYLCDSCAYGEKVKMKEEDKR